MFVSQGNNPRTLELRETGFQGIDLYFQGFFQQEAVLWTMTLNIFSFMFTKPDLWPLAGIYHTQVFWRH